MICWGLIVIDNFSPNMLKTYESCPKKYYYRYVENISVPISSLPFEKGKKIHALANYYLQGVNISRIETALSQEEKDVWQLLLNNPFYKKDYLKSEFPIMTRLDDFWIGGRIDAIVHDAESYYILDYKTGSTPKNPEFDYQTMIYLLCVNKFLKKYDSLSFVYINLKDKNNYVIEFNDKLKSQYELKIKEACASIKTDVFYQPNCKSCDRCEYSKICNDKF